MNVTDCVQASTSDVVLTITPLTHGQGVVKTVCKTDIVECLRATVWQEKKNVAKLDLLHLHCSLLVTCITLIY